MKFPDREGRQLEFKESLESYSGLIKTVLAFLNDIGGRIIIGVEDKSQEIVGLSETEIERHLERIPQAVFDAVTPTCRPIVRVVRYNDNQVVEVLVHEGSVKPYFLTSMGILKGVFIRVGAHTKPANDEFIAELTRTGLGRSFDLEPVIPYDQVDWDLDLLKSCYGTTSPKNEVLVADRILVVDRVTSEIKVTVAGILFFAKDPKLYFPQAEILVTVYRGSEIADRFKSVDFSGPLEALLVQALNYIEKEIPVEQAVVGSRLKTLRHEVPLLALREALMNALIHRRYDIQESIKVTIFSDRIRIQSPGNFPGPITDFLSGVSYARNPHLRQLARKRGLVEKRGLGFHVLFSTSLKNNNPAPLIEELPMAVAVSLYRTQLKDRSSKLPTSLIPLSQLFENRQSFQTGEAAAILKVTANTARKWLTDAKEAGLLRSKGSGRTAKWEWVV